MVVKHGGAAELHKLRHSSHGAVVDVLGVDVAPDVVAVEQPVEQLRVLHGGDVAAECLEEMVVGIHKARVDKAALGVDDFGALRAQVLAQLKNFTVLDQNVGVTKEGILLIAGNNGLCIAN